MVVNVKSHHARSVQPASLLPNNCPNYESTNPWYSIGVQQNNIGKRQITSNTYLLFINLDVYKTKKKKKKSPIDRLHLFKNICIWY